MNFEPVLKGAAVSFFRPMCNSILGWRVLGTNLVSSARDHLVSVKGEVEIMIIGASFSKHLFDTDWSRTEEML